MPVRMRTAEDPQQNVIELAIHEFDQWAGPAEPFFAPTTFCWGKHDPSLDSAE